MLYTRISSLVCDEIYWFFCSLKLMCELLLYISDIGNQTWKQDFQLQKLATFENLPQKILTSFKRSSCRYVHQKIHSDKFWWEHYRNRLKNKKLFLAANRKVVPGSYPQYFLGNILKSVRNESGIKKKYCGRVRKKTAFLCRLFRKTNYWKYEKYIIILWPNRDKSKIIL